MKKTSLSIVPSVIDYVLFLSLLLRLSHLFPTYLSAFSELGLVLMLSVSPLKQAEHGMLYHFLYAQHHKIYHTTK